MEKKKYNISYRNDSGQILECRQCSHENLLRAMKEAELYRAWAVFHYGCNIYYDIFDE